MRKKKQGGELNFLNLKLFQKNIIKTGRLKGRERQS